MLFVPKIRQDDVEATSGKNFLPLLLRSDDLKQRVNFFFTDSGTWLKRGGVVQPGAGGPQLHRPCEIKTEEFSDSPQLSLMRYSCTLSELGTAVFISLFLAQHSSGI